MEFEPEEFATFVKSIQLVSPAEIVDQFHTYDERRMPPKLLCKFYLVRCVGDKFREDDLIKFMCKKALFYVLSTDEYQGKNIEEYRDLLLRVKETFVKSKITGEPGELLLFILLEAEGIVQLYSKMRLKTGGNIAFNGYDAVHIQGGQGIVFHLGHSKMYANFGQAVDAALADVKKFDDDKAQKERELSLISSHLDEKKFGEYSKEIRDIINPYSRNRKHYSEVNSIFVGANLEFMTKGSEKGDKSLDDYMDDIYGGLIDGIAKTIDVNVKSRNGLNEFELRFYVLPFEDVQKFRNEFLTEMGR